MFMQQIRRFCLATVAVVLTTMMTFGLSSASSWASILPTSSTNSTYLASAGRAEALAKGAEGRTQEAIGNVTGDRQDQLMGKAKQVESQARNVVEDAKDGLESLSERARASSNIVEGKAQKARGNVTGDRQDQLMGEAKQSQGEARNVVEDVKGRIQDMFN
ncbi:MAG: CsbD family protein [Leptolyngbya sp. DLM2.Bin15]|nr:MAG: CsbD family protein [Leptolyngbya sp. DLM2.Bin15]